MTHVGEIKLVVLFSMQDPIKMTLIDMVYFVYTKMKKREVENYINVD